MSKRKNVFSTKTIVTLGLLIALSIVLERLLMFMPTDSIRISFGNLPIILAGLLFGPIAGGLAAFSADLIGSLLLSPYPWFPPMSLTFILMGVVPPLIGMLLRKRTKLPTFIAMILPAEILGPVLWSTLSLQWLYGVPFLVNLPIRAPVKIAIAVIDITLVFLLYKSGLFNVLGLDRYGGNENGLRGDATLHPQHKVAGK